MRARKQVFGLIRSPLADILYGTHDGVVEPIWHGLLDRGPALGFS
jgi:hypothetical protein